MYGHYLYHYTYSISLKLLMELEKTFIFAPSFNDELTQDMLCQLSNCDKIIVIKQFFWTFLI